MQKLFVPLFILAFLSVGTVGYAAPALETKVERTEEITFEAETAEAEEAELRAVAEDFAWSLDETTGTLTISGHGDMPNYDYVPWYPQTYQIKNVVITDGITSIANRAFYGCNYLTDITIPDGLTKIGSEAFSSTAWYDAQPDGVLYINDVLYRYKGEMPDETNIDVNPGTVSISCHAFYGCYGLKSVTIPDSVISIGSDAFSFCGSLTKIVVDKNNPCYSSDEYAVLFNKEKSEIIRAVSTIKSYVIPNTVTNIGDYAFLSCDELTSITIPDSVTSIGEGAFGHCINLKDVTIPSSVENIGGEAFAHCYCLTSITIPNGVTSIENSTFTYCENLTDISLPDSVTTIGDFAFNGCSSFIDIKIPNDVTSIGAYAFGDCKRLRTISIPNGVTNIDEGVFNNCCCLASIAIPDGVTSIGSDAFRDCSSLTNITIPDSVTSIGMYAFYDCESLKTVYYTGLEEDWKNINIFYGNDCLLDAIVTKQSMTWSFDDSTGTLTIGGMGSIPSLGGLAAPPWHLYYDQINNVVISDGITSIGDYAFADCNFMARITIPSSVIRIGIHAFGYGPYNPINDVYYIGSEEEWNKIEIHSTNLRLINANNFYYRNNINVTGITLNITHTRLNIGDTEALTAAIVPSNATDKNVTWSSSDPSVATVSSSGVITAIAAGTATVTANTTDGNKTATSRVIVNEKFKNTLTYSFDESTGTLTVHGHGDIPDDADWDYISKYKIKNVVIADGVKSIGNRVFSNCYNLTKITIPSGVTSIGTDAFMGCSSLTSITIPDGVTSISSGAFCGCSSLTSVTISKNVTSIGYTAFSWCSNLKDIYYTGSESEWNNIDIDAVSSEYLRKATIHYNYVPGEPTVTPGDLGGDGEINDKDNMLLARYLAGWDGYDETTINLEAADLNGDGKVNVKDNMILARHLAGWVGYETLPIKE